MGHLVCICLSSLGTTEIRHELQQRSKTRTSDSSALCKVTLRSEHHLRCTDAVPAGYLAKRFGWQWGMMAPGAFGLVAGFLLLFALADKPESAGQLAQQRNAVAKSRFCRLSPYDTIGSVHSQVDSAQHSSCWQVHLLCTAVLTSIVHTHTIIEQIRAVVLPPTYTPAYSHLQT